MEDSSPSTEDILNHELGISTNDSLASALSSVDADIDFTNETERLLFGGGLNTNDIKTLNKSTEMQLLIEAGIIKKGWHGKGRDLVKTKADIIVQYDNKLKNYFESNKGDFAYTLIKTFKNGRNMVKAQVPHSTVKKMNLIGHDGKVIPNYALQQMESVTNARIVADIMSTLLIKLTEFDDNDSRIQYLTNVLDSPPSTWVEGYTPQARVKIISKYIIPMSVLNTSISRRQMKYNFSSDKDIKTAYLKEMEERDIILNTDQTDSLVQQAAQSLLDKFVPPTKALKYRKDVITEAIESETFDVVVTSSSPFTQPSNHQRETLLSKLTPHEKNNLRGDISIILGQFCQTCYTPEDVQSAVGNKTIFKPIESQPCFGCGSCGTKIGYTSTAQAKDRLAKTHNTEEKNRHLVKHLLSCDKFKEKETEYNLLVKELKQHKGRPTGVTNEMVIKLSRLDGIAGGDDVVPIVYNHQERIEKARETYNLAEKKFGKVNPKHVPLHVILKDPEFEKLIKYIISHDGINQNVNYDLDNLRDLFKRLGKVDIYEFRTPDEWKSSFVNKTASHIIHEMYIFTLRVRQEECAQGEQGDYPVENRRFGGALTHQSNHIEADGEPPESEKAKTKNFDLAVGNASRSIIEITDEACKTMLTSVQKHNTFHWDKPNRDMPTELYSKEEYPPVKKVVTFSVVQDSDKGREVHALIDKLAANIDDDDAKTYDAVYVTERVEEATGYDRRDLAPFDNDEYDDGTNKDKINFLKMIEYYFERREAGGCFMSCCTVRFRNRPRKDFCWFDGHHANSDSKEDEPSQYHKMSIKKARLERRKCVPLCRPCHMEVHHTPGKEEEFKTELEKEHMVGADGQIEELADEADNDE